MFEGSYQKIQDILHNRQNIRINKFDVKKSITNLIEKTNLAYRDNEQCNGVDFNTAERYVNQKEDKTDLGILKQLYDEMMKRKEDVSGLLRIICFGAPLLYEV